MPKNKIRELFEKIIAKKKEIKPTPIPTPDPIIGPIEPVPGPIHHGEPIPVDPPIKPKPVDK